MEEQRYTMRGQITVVNMPGEGLENKQNKCVHQALVLVSQALVCVNVCIIHLHLLLIPPMMSQSVATLCKDFLLPD